MNPTPIPTPTDLVVDPNRVTPGLLGFLSFVFLIITVVVIYFGIRKQLNRVDFDETAVPAGVRPLPKYATKDERRKTALRLQKEREAAEQARAGTAGVGGVVADVGGVDAGDSPDDPTEEIITSLSTDSAAVDPQDSSAAAGGGVSEGSTSGFSSPVDSASGTDASLGGTDSPVGDGDNTPPTQP